MTMRSSDFASRACVDASMPRPGRLTSPFYYFHFFFQTLAEAAAVAFLQAIESRRLFNDFFETALRGGCAIAANQQRDFADVGDIFKQIDEPDFADKSGHADQQEVPIRERFADGEALDAGDVAPNAATALPATIAGGALCLHGAFR